MAMSESVDTKRTEFDRAIERFNRLIQDTSDELSIILRGHLLLEEKLTAIVTSAVRNPEYVSKARLSFLSTLFLARSFVGHFNDSACWDAIEKLNSIRNKFAHQIEPAGSDELFAPFFEICERERRWAYVHTLPRGRTKLIGYIGVVWGTLDALLDVVQVCVEHAPSPLTSRSIGQIGTPEHPG